MLEEPSTFTGVLLSREGGKVKAGLADWAWTGSGVNVSDSSFGVAVRASAIAESLSRVFLECMIDTEINVVKSEARSRSGLNLFYAPIAYCLIEIVPRLSRQ